MKVSKNIVTRFDPLQTVLSFDIEGGSTVQSYNFDFGEYEPDRDITPLLIIPIVQVFDPHGILESGRVNKYISFRWYRNGELIVNGEDYQVDNTQTDTRGALTVMENVLSGERVTLDFEAEYLDSRKGQLVRFRGKQVLSCETVEKSDVQILIDKPTTMTYNPISDQREITINLKALNGSREIEKIKYFLYTKNGDVIEPVNADSHDLEIVSFTGNVLKVDLAYINNVKNYRVYGTQYVDDAPVSPATDSPLLDFSIKRRFPMYEIDFDDYGRIQPWQDSYKVEAVVLVNGVAIEDPAKYFDIDYYHKRVNTNYCFGHGNEATLKFPAGVYEKDSAVELEVAEKESLKAMSDNGKVVTFNNMILVV